jgi:hypothetical protein
MLPLLIFHSSYKTYLSLILTCYVAPEESRNDQRMTEHVFVSLMNPFYRFRCIIYRPVSTLYSKALLI